jgi:ABC-type polysaccharide/polyol phosphate transport system ATPase subunit
LLTSSEPGNAIEIEGLSKRYRLGVSQGDLRETISEAVRRRGRRGAQSTPPLASREFEALRDVSLTVAAGEAIGLIGRNGAGKSTLLKILSRITEPTAGVCRTRGRVGALLEVGTGFHGELTGRENVFLNGAILGMPRQRVARSLDDIIAFAGVERFIDTPVKRYSSGMFLRLAFAVAAHLESDILLVDEVLAVGDFEFQQRCLGRMSEVEAEGRTVVFVSHDLNAVATLCDRVVWLDRGAVVADGPSRPTIDRYLASAQAGATHPEQWTVADSGVALRAFATLTDLPGGRLFDRRQPIRLRFEYEVAKPLGTFYASVQIHDTRGRVLVEEPLPVPAEAQPGVVSGVMEIPPLLNVGQYSASFWAGDSYESYVLAEQAIAFDVVGDDEGVRKPALRVPVTWEMSRS